MKLNIWMIFDHLEEYTAVPYLDQTVEMNLIAPVFYERGQKFEDNYIYISPASELPKEPEFGLMLHLIVIGEPPETYRKKHVNLITVGKDADLLRLFRTVQKCFEFYQAWDADLQNVLYGDNNLNQLLKVSAGIFGNPLNLYDADYAVLAYTEEVGLWDENKADGNYMLSMKILNNFKTEKEFLATMHTEGASLYTGRTLPYAVLYTNLSETNIYNGRICVIGSNRPFRRSDYALIEHLAKALRIALRRQSGDFTNGYFRAFEGFLANILGGKIIDSGQADRYLAGRNWKEDDSYLCIKIGIEERDIHTASTKYSCNRLESALGDCCTFPYENGIVCIVHLNEDRHDKHSLTKMLSYFLRDSLFKAGISNVYRNLFQSSVAYMQASVSLTMGIRHNPTHWYHKFEDYAMPYIFQNGVRDMGPAAFCDENVLRLRDMNSKDGADYYTTLRIYLQNNMNLLHTAEALHIHRTTLYYRLNRLKEMLDVDLCDPAARFRLMLSYVLLDLEEKYGYKSN